MSHWDFHYQFFFLIGPIYSSEGNWVTLVKSTQIELNPNIINSYVYMYICIYVYMYILLSSHRSKLQNCTKPDPFPPVLSVLGSDQLQQPHQCLRLDLSRGWEGEWDGNVQTPHWLMIMLGMIKGSKRLLNTGHLQACREYYDYFVRLGYLLNPIDQYFMG